MATGSEAWREAATGTDREAGKGKAEEEERVTIEGTTEGRVFFSFAFSFLFFCTF